MKLKEAIYVKSPFPIWVKLSQTGEILIEDLVGDVWVVYRHDGGCCSYTDYTNILNNKEGFWSVAKQYKLRRVEWNFLH
jgi:hypothetical protein